MKEGNEIECITERVRGWDETIIFKGMMIWKKENEMISDPNIPETGEQAARALHSNEENECCFHACSEELAGSGICANCTNQVLRRRGKNYDPPTAPYCEVNCTQPASTGTFPQLSLFSRYNPSEFLQEKIIWDNSTRVIPKAIVLYKKKKKNFVLLVWIRWRIPRHGIHG